MPTLKQIVDSLIAASYDTGYYAGQKREDSISKNAIKRRTDHTKRLLDILDKEIGIDIVFDPPCSKCGSTLGHYVNCPLGTCTIRLKK